MPEYLAPGVYVEETSFRAKSIEGVSTSTTGFVGPTRRGPIAHNVAEPTDEAFVASPLELLTGFGDFQRIYGDLDDLDYGPNYLAHAVRAYFDNGGSRLYVARVFGPPAGQDGVARSADLGGGVRWVARSPGGAGNGTIRLVPHLAEARRRSMERAAEGTTLQVGVQAPAAGARLTGGRAPFSLPPNGRLSLSISGAATIDVPLTGAAAEITAANPLPPDLDLAAASQDDRTLVVTFDGTVSRVLLSAADDQTPDQIVQQINPQLVGGYARLQGGSLVFGSDVQGTASSVSLGGGAAAALLGFAGAGPFASAPAAGTVPNIRRVTAADISAALVGPTAGAVTASADLNGNLVLATVATGAAVSLTIREAGGPGTSVHALLNFADGQSEPGRAGATSQFFVKRGNSWQGDTAFNFADLDNIPGGAAFVTLGVVADDADGMSKNYDDLGLAIGHPRFVGTVLSEAPTRRADDLQNVFALQVPQALRTLSIANDTALRNALLASSSVPLSGGSDGVMPETAHYAAGLRQLRVVEGISIVAAPGSSAYPAHAGIQGALVSHAEQRRAYRIAVLDAAPGSVLSQVQTEKSRIDSTYAALYYPWVIVDNPLARVGDETIPREIALPPSGFVCGIYARSDVNRGVFKAPANEIVRGALRYDMEINFAQQQELNPQGINCLRFFPGRGNRVWGARTASSDPEWKYVNIRRYFNYLERSVDIGTQWAVFEPNGERLWTNVRETVSSFLFNEWRSGALLGASPQEAFFVRCDRSTMDQNDLDNGRLICLVGVAAIKPAEFVIFRVGQKLADARS